MRADRLLLASEYFEVIGDAIKDLENKIDRFSEETDCRTTIIQFQVNQVGPDLVCVVALVEFEDKKG